MKKLLWGAGFLVCVAGCAVTENDSVEQELRACPELVRRDESGNPRNAAGQIRQCWPGNAHCFCDRDNDCYAEEGYVPCQPMSAVTTDSGVRDSGVRDSGVRDSGVRDSGVRDSGAREAGTVDAGVRDAGPVISAPIAADAVSYTGSFAVRNGRSRAQLRVAGEARDVTVYVPSTRPSAPALVLAFHGTNGSGDVMLDESSARAMADRSGAVFIAPDSRWMPRGDWDHATEETYWQTSGVSPGANPDLLLTRAIIVEAQRRFGIDPRRIYAIGHSNGGFFAELVATQLSSRIAGFAVSSAGLVRCSTTRGCRFQGSGSTCAALRSQAGWCGCSGPDLPGPIPTSGRIPPAYLTHGTRDPLVSVQYTCALAERMAGAGAAATVVLRNGDGHVMPETFALDAWAFLSSRRLP
ncbi:MAG: hypothetical protein EPO40_16710 [Myxococcaceae bacterium]|nr:MAG: hypothetical protein EPO40_16710 [Myxococcaceae bacterium]